jgi:4-oxalocrotonate tautomerase family enzyme
MQILEKPDGFVRRDLTQLSNQPHQGDRHAGVWCHSRQRFHFQPASRTFDSVLHEPQERHVMPERQMLDDSHPVTDSPVRPSPASAALETVKRDPVHFQQDCAPQPVPAPLHSLRLESGYPHQIRDNIEVLGHPIGLPLAIITVACYYFNSIYSIKEEESMPVIQITMGKSSAEQKKTLIERLSADAIEITKIPASEFTVLITELETDNIGRAGRTLTDIRSAKA